MPLSIRNPRVENLARSISMRQGRSMTEVIGSALEEYDKNVEVDIVALGKRLAQQLKMSSTGKGLGRNLTKDEINAEWMD